MRKNCQPNIDSMLAALAAMPSPRSHDEWRQASTALRSVRREARRIRRACMARIICGSSHRYLAACTNAQTALCYNGPSRMTAVLMIGFNRRQRVLYGESRIADARSWARAARVEGPVALAS